MHWEELINTSPSIRSICASHSSVLEAFLWTRGLQSCSKLSFDRKLIIFSKMLLIQLERSAVTLQGTNDGWRSTREWVRKDGKLDFAYLKHHFGDALVSCTECNRCAFALGRLQVRNSKTRSCCEVCWLFKLPVCNTDAVSRVSLEKGTLMQMWVLLLVLYCRLHKKYQSLL